MKLEELLVYEDIVIQCHDNPDADALASGFGLYLYFKSKSKNVRLVYGGKYIIQKSNLILMVSELNIPIVHVEELNNPELLITVDCQYGEGNVTRFDAKNVAVIDHHQVSGVLPKMNVVRSSIGACSTIVREMLEEAGFDINADVKLATALYYGLLTDTSNFTEISHPLDKDMRDDMKFERSYITKFRNANLSISELEIAGNALLGAEYNEQYRFAIIQAKPCDPNILGMISDLMLEVDSVDTCLVYSILPFGIKVSVRSCIKEVKASELAEFITNDIGSGGGHIEKAGGFIQNELLDKVIGTQSISEFLFDRMCNYFKNVEIIFSQEYEFQKNDMRVFMKRDIPCGYILLKEVFPIGTEITMRTLDGDIDIIVDEDVVLMIGTAGEVYPAELDKFEADYIKEDEPYIYPGEYPPVVRNRVEGEIKHIVTYARSCRPSGKTTIYAQRLDHRVKLFNLWDEDRYYVGNVGDYLAVHGNDLHDVYIVKKDIFETIYDLVQ